jgi:hypothetical protein
MSSLIAELIHIASDQTISTSDLLKRTLVTAKRLDVPELVDWVQSELKGYTSAEVPDYRRIRGELVIEHPKHGVIRYLMCSDITESFVDVLIHQSISELAELGERKNDFLRYFPSGEESFLMEIIYTELNVVARPAVRFSSQQINQVIEMVRTQILSVALDLEQRGVQGKGMTFTPQEKSIVQEQHYHFGNVSSSQIQINSSGTQQNSTNSNDLDSLNELIDAFNKILDLQLLDAEVIGELRAEISTLQAQARSPKPKWSIISATALSLKTIAESAAGNVLSALGQPYVSTLLALAGLKI